MHDVLRMETAPERLGRRALGGLLWALCLLLLLVILPGYAGQAFDGRCAVAQAGVTDGGVPVLRVYCVPEPQ